MTVHPQTGKKEYIFVDLAAIYPTPEEPGTELSFEEIVAANRGWMDCSWEEDTVDESLVEMSDAHLNEISQASNSIGGEFEVHRDFDMQDENAGSRVVGKLQIHRDLGMHDENGARKAPLDEARPAKKKKMMEVNETQVSK